MPSFFSLISLISLAAFLFPPIAASQDIAFHRIALPASPSIAQDAEGYLWMSAIRVGLYKYDGSVQKAYTPNASENSLAHANINDLVIDPQGIIWMGSDNGLIRFNPVTEQFKSYIHDPHDPQSLSNDVINHVLFDKNGMLWLGTNDGLNRFDPARESFTRFMHDLEDPESLSYPRVIHLFEDKAGTLWVGTGKLVYSTSNVGGLNRFEPQTDSFKRFVHDPNDPTSLPHNQAQALYEDPQGVLWVGTGKGLYHMDPEREIFLKGGLTDAAHRMLDHASISAIHESKQGDVWIGRWEAGVSRFGPGISGAGSHFTHDPADPVTRESYNMNYPYRFFESRDGTLWILGYEAEPVKIVPSPGHALTYLTDKNGKNPFTDEIVTCLLEDRTGNIWAGTRTGRVLKHDTHDSLFTEIRARAAGRLDLFTHYTCTLTEDHRGNVWMAVEVKGGLERYAPSTNSISKHLAAAQSSSGVLPWSENTINHVFEDDQQRLWAGTNLGLLSYSVDKDATHSYDDSRVVSNIVQQTDGSLIFGTETNGIKKLDSTTNQRQASTILPKLRADVLFMENDSLFWLGTTDGLYKFDGATENTTRIAGLPLLNVRGLAKDSQGFLWITTGESRNLTISARPEAAQLWRFDPDTQTFGLINLARYINPIGFADRTTLSTHAGDLLFGGAGGILRLNPSAANAFIEQFDHNETHLTDVLVFGESISQKSTRSHIELTYLEHDVTFAFANFDYRTPGVTNFQYKLSPRDTEWIDAGTLQKTRYSGLTPDAYRFDVRAINGVGMVGKTTSIKMIIHPPWWKTKLAYGAYLMLFTLCLIWAGYYQEKRVISKEREKTRERELAQAQEIEQAYTQLKATQEQLIHTEKMASLGALTAGIAHEINNPLNFVNNFSRLSVGMLEELKEWINSNGGKDEQEVFQMLILNAKKINEHGLRANQIVTSMMQHANGVTGERLRVDINELIKEYTNLVCHNWQLNAGQINEKQPPNGNTSHAPQIILDLSEQVGKINIIPQEIGKVLVNLLNNAFDAVKGVNNAKIAIQSAQDNDHVEIRIIDNGSGIPLEYHDKIFEPFFTTKRTGSRTGLGLSLSYDIITQAHGGSIHFINQEGQGTCFVVRLPVDFSV